MKAKAYHTCPACGQTLSINHLDGQVFMWCAFGRCISEAANNGAHGSDEHEAYDRLVAAVELEDELSAD